MSTSHPPVRVAVIGTGLAGLATAYLLSQAQHTHSDGSRVEYEVHLVERNERLGMDAASVSVPLEAGGGGGKKEVRVDVPMRSINGGSHSRVKKLYDRLNVPLIESDFGYSFSRLYPFSSSSSSTSPSPSSPPPSPSTDSLPSTPPPSYTSAPSSLPSTPPPLPSSSSSSSSRSFPRPLQTTHLLYSGSSGLSWPPLPFPSHTHSSLLAQFLHLKTSLLLTLSYLYLLALSFFYVSLGLSRPAPPSPPLGARVGLRDTLKRRWIQRFSIAAEPLDRFLLRHRLGGGEGELGELVRVLMAAVATVGVEEAGKMPVGELLEYITSTFLSPHYRTSPSFGVRGIVRALVSPIPPARIHLGTTIVRIEAREGGGYAVVCAGKAREGGEEEGKEERLEVDHLVFATQADQAASLLSTLTSSSSASSSPSSHYATEDKQLQRALSALRTFTYARTLVVTHRDESLLPPNSADRRDLNLAVYASPPPPSPPMTPGAKEAEKQGGEEQDEEGDTLPPSSVQTTHIISPSPVTPSSSSPSAPLILQTTNPLLPIPPSLTFSKTWFSRAVVNPRSQASVGLFSPSCPLGLQGLSLGHGEERAEKGGKEGRGQGGRKGGIWFAGSYLAPGIPLLEGCVESAEGVVEGLGGRYSGSTA